MYDYSKQLYNPPYDKSKCCVIIPIKNRIHHLKISLPHWLEQTYSNFEIVIVDYDSSDDVTSLVKRIAREYNCDVVQNPDITHDRYHSYEKISILRLEDKPTFNMAHACNYGIRNSHSDVVQVCGCDAVPLSYYLELVMSILSEDSIVVRPTGRLCFPRDCWWRVNGYQEICRGWGAEDYDMRQRISQNSKPIVISENLIYSLHHADSDRTHNYEEQNSWISNETNLDRCEQYFNMFGPIGNYNLLPGGEFPIEFRDVNEGILHVVLSENDVEQSIAAKRSVILHKFAYKNKIVYASFVPSIPENHDHTTVFSDSITGEYFSKQIDYPLVSSVVSSIEDMVIDLIRS